MHTADQDGKLLGADAVKFFERSGLPRDQLAKVSATSSGGTLTLLVSVIELSQLIWALTLETVAQVWALSDNARRGYLDQRTFGKVSVALLLLASTRRRLERSCINHTISVPVFSKSSPYPHKLTLSHALPHCYIP